jgi:hypothetical protein
MYSIINSHIFNGVFLWFDRQYMTYVMHQYESNTLLLRKQYL